MNVDRKKKSNSKSRKILGILFVLPALILVIISRVYPFIWNFVISFFKWDLFSKIKWVFVDNYTNMIKDTVLKRAVNNSLYMGIVAAVIGVLLGMILALMIYRMRKTEGAIYRTVFFIPSMLPQAVVGLLFVFILNPDMGLLNNFLRQIGLSNLEHAWLSDKKVVLITISVISGWKLTGLSMMLFYTAINSLPHTFFESAQIDGIGYLRQIYYIIIPLIKPTIQLTTMLCILNTFKAYDLVAVLTNGGPGTYTTIVPMHMLTVGFTYNEFGRSGAIAMLFALMVTAVMYIFNKLLKGEVYEY